MRGRIGAYVSWARTTDPAGRTAPGRAAALKRFERQVDPDGTLPPAERTRRADAAKRAHMLALSRRSAQVRARRKAAGQKRGGDAGNASGRLVS